MNKDIIAEVNIFVKRKLNNDKTGHDYYHAQRVNNLAKRIAKEEGANIFVCEIASLLHDVIDYKVVDNQERAMEEVSIFLNSLSLKKEELENIDYIIRNISFNGGINKKMNSREGLIVQDADRLDAIGAIGIARTMIFTGAKGRTLHIPDLEPRKNMTLKEYRSSNGTTINHFYEKLLKLKEIMNTNSAKIIADERHKFLEIYLEQFYAEWNGNK